MLPFLSDLTLGKDYQLFSINEQLELLFSIKTGSFPLYVPGYSLGHSSSALTLSQVYHPISHIASLLPGYWNGKALEWNTFLRLLTLGLTHLVLFVFLRKMVVNTLFSLLLSFITVYNLRMLEAFRYGASLEAYTGYLLLCAVIGLYFISPSRWLGPLSIMGITYLLVCSGHPPMMFYGLLGAGLFTLVAPFFLAAMLPGRNINFKIALRFWTKVGSYICLGILLSSAYIVPFYFEFVTTNIEYAHSGYQAHMGQDTFVGALNNFFMPFISDVLSTFGGSSLFVIPLLFPLLICFRVKIPPPIWAIWGVVLFAFFYILGPQTPVFRLAWEYIPLVSSVGSVGRISLIVPFFLMLLLAWVIKAESVSFRLKGLPEKLTPYTLLGFIALLLIPLYLSFVFLLKPKFGSFPPHFIRNIPFWIEFLSVLFGMLSLAALIFYGMYRRFAVFLCLLILLQVGIILKYGMFIEKKQDKPTFEQIKLLKKENLEFHYHQNPSMHHFVVLTQLRRSFIEPFLGKIYTQVIPVSSQDDTYEKMRRERLPQQVFVEGYDSGKAKFMTEEVKNIKEGTVSLVYSSFNRLQFRVISPAPAFFGMSYPFTGHWRAWVNDEEVRVYRANGAAHAVEIPKGESIIEFRYWSDTAFWGMFITCMTFTIIGLYVCAGALRDFLRPIGIVFVLMIGMGGFILWYYSLYTGDNLKTEYTWFYTPPQSSPNLAYGKKTSGFSPTSAFLHLHSSNAVDGDTKPGSGFVLEPLDDRALIVDLYKNQEIKTILLYYKARTKPLVALSPDGEKWQKLAFDFAEGSHVDPLRIVLEKSVVARFVKIEASGPQTGIDELEVYGPEPI